MCQHCTLYLCLLTWQVSEAIPHFSLSHYAKSFTNFSTGKSMRSESLANKLET